MDDRGWCDPDDFDDPLLRGFKAELSPGERLLWTGRPSLPRLRRVRLIPLAFVLVLTALSGVSLAAVLGVFHQDVINLWVAAAAFGLAPAALGGLLLLDAACRSGRWIHRRWSLARTVYALTDQRAIIGKIEGRGLNAFSLVPGMIDGTTRYEYSDGSGDLYFEGLDAFFRAPVGFFRIPCVRRVDLLLRETLIDPFPRW